MGIAYFYLQQNIIKWSEMKWNNCSEVKSGGAETEKWREKKSLKAEVADVWMSHLFPRLFQVQVHKPKLNSARSRE